MARSHPRGGAVRQGPHRPLRAVEAGPGRIHLYGHIRRQRFAMAAGVGNAGEVRHHEVRRAFPGRHERHRHSGMFSHEWRWQVHRLGVRRVLQCCQYSSGVNQSGHAQTKRGRGERYLTRVERRPCRAPPHPLQPTH